MYVAVSLTEMDDGYHSEQENHGVYEDKADAEAKARAIMANQGKEGDEEDEYDKWWRREDEMVHVVT